MTAFTAGTVPLDRDDFTGAVGSVPLSGRLTEEGNTWVSEGNATEWSQANNRVERSVISQTTSAFSYPDFGNLTNTYVRADVSVVNAVYPTTISFTQFRVGVMARYIDSDNYIAAVFRGWDDDSGNIPMGIYTRINGSQSMSTTSTDDVDPNQPTSVELWVLENGEAYAQFKQGSFSATVVKPINQLFATGGSMATGKVGIIDHNSVTDPATRIIDNFEVAIPDPNGAFNWSAKGDIRVVPTLPSISSSRPNLGQPEVSFSTSPVGAQFSYVADGNVYTPAGANYTSPDTAITFTPTVTLPPGRHVVEYHWDFGDGIEGWGNPVTHTYKHTNLHCQAVLRVTDNKGERHYARKQMYLKTP